MKNFFVNSGSGLTLTGLVLVTALFSSGCVSRRYGYGPGYYGPRYDNPRHHDNDRDRDHRRDHDRDRDGYRYR